MVFRERKASTVHVGNHPTCISFSGCGFLGIYHIGVATCFKQHAPEFIKGLKRVYGCSAGSIIGAMMLNDVCCGQTCKSTLEMANDIRSRYLGPFSPSFKFTEMLRKGFKKYLPKDAHLNTSGRLFISLTRLCDMKNVIVSEYASQDELIDALLCSCFVPFYSGIIPPKYRGVYYVDGGLSNNLPTDPDTITVSPWSGGSDICPRNDASESLIDINLVNTSVQMTMSNLYRFSTMFYPPKAEVLSDFCKQGFRETLQYLLEHGLLETPYPPSQVMPELQTTTLSLDDLSRLKPQTSESSIKFYLEDCPEEALSEVFEIDSGVSETGSNDFGKFVFDEDGNDLDLNQNQDSCEEAAEEKDVATRKLKFVPSVTVMKMHPAEEHTLKLHFTLPMVVVQALDDNYLNCNAPTWRRPVAKLISMCGNTLVIRIPLDQSYRIACWILENVSLIPNNVNWLIHYVVLFVSLLHDYFQEKGAALVSKLRESKNALGEDIQILSYKLSVLVNIILHHIAKKGSFKSVSHILQTSTFSKLAGLLSS